MKKAMMGLWKENFGDSDAYIKLVFDTYYDESNIAASIVGNEAEASLLGVPYTFRRSDDDTLRGLYLCGLSTRREKRRKGLMSALIEEINARALRGGYDFTFLIPSDSGIRKYYSDRGYHNAFYKKRECYVKGHNFHSQLDSAVRVEKFSGEGREELLGFLCANERRCSRDGSSDGKTMVYQLVHTRRDWEAVVADALMDTGGIYIIKEGESVVGAAFYAEHKDGIEVREMILSDSRYRAALLQGVLDSEGVERMALTVDFPSCDDDGNAAVWQPFYAQNNGKNAEYEDIAEVGAPFDPAVNAFPYAMIRLLDVKALMDKLGISGDRNYDGFTEKELIEVLLRKPSGGSVNPLGEMLGLVDLDFTGALLLE